MSKLLSVLTALAISVAATAAFGGSMTLLGVGKAPGASASPTWTNQAAAINASCGFTSTCAISGLSITSGYVVFNIGQSGDNAAPASAVLSAGCSGTLSNITGAADTVNFIGASMWAGTVTGGASCTITITSSAHNYDGMGVAYGTLSNLSSTTPGTAFATDYDNQAGPFTCGGAVTVSAGGFGIAGVWGNLNGTYTSSNTTIDAQATHASSNFTIAISHTASTISSPGASFGGLSFGRNIAMCAPWR